MRQLMLGKTPARPGAVKLKFRDYLTALPTPPKEFGHEGLISSWGMNGNDVAGCCVEASKAHVIEVWNAEAGKHVIVSTANTLADYSTITGYDPNDPSTDRGTDMQVAAAYFKSTGYLDAQGVRHKVGAYLAITPGDIKEHLQAMWLFSAVEIGITISKAAMRQFQLGMPWTYCPMSPKLGGHCIPLVAERKNRQVCVTWAKLQPMTTAFFKAYNDESLVYLSEEMLSGGKSPEGFNLAHLQADLKAL